MTAIAHIDRYIGWRVLAGTLLMLGVLTSLFVLAAVVDAAKYVGKGDFGLWNLAEYVVLSQPRRLYESFPVAAMVGTLGGLSVLAVNAELTALRAAGVSIARIVLATMKTGLLLVAGVALLGELVVPASETRAQEGRAEALATGLQTRGGGLWLRDGAAYVNIGEVLPDRSMLRVTVYEFEKRPNSTCPGSCPPETHLRQYLRAERARFEGNGWRLEKLRVSELTRDRVTTTQVGSQMRESTLSPDIVAAFAVRPEGLSAANLARYIRHLAGHGQDTRRYRLAFWQKLFLPFAVGVMVLLAAPFVFQPARGGAFGQRIFLGLVLGLAFLVANRSFGYLGLLYGMPPIVGALMPLLLFLALAVFLLRRVR